MFDAGRHITTVMRNINNDRYPVKYNPAMARNEQKAQTRQRILDAAGKSFRQGGFGGIGVDGLSKAAGVTSGAFYVHFDSKSAAFLESVVQGVADVERGIRHFQAEHGKDWWPQFVHFYLGEKRKCDLKESCGLQSLSSEVARADPEAREAFTAELLRVAEAVIALADSRDAPATVDEAYAALATLIGGVTLARAVDNPQVARTIVEATERVLLPAEASRDAVPRSKRRNRKQK
jgi:AcrR family transcriptional regulator